MTCAVYGCRSASRSLGYCSMHYQRKRNTGTTEPRNMPRGVSKLTPDVVVKIRSDCRTQSAIARDFGVSPTLVRVIKLRWIWKHVS